MSAFVSGNKKGLIVEGETDDAWISVHRLRVFEQETEQQIAEKLTNLLGLGNLQGGNVCPSCCDILRDTTLNDIKVQVLDTLRSKTKIKMVRIRRNTPCAKTLSVHDAKKQSFGS